MTVKQAHNEWDYKIVENKFTGHDLPVSKPCQLKFKEPPTQDTARFHQALESNGYTWLDDDPDEVHQNSGKVHYEGEICLEKSYHRVRVLVFRERLVRLYPYDDYVPTVDELSALIEAIETGFDAPLEHTPIQEPNKG